MAFTVERRAGKAILALAGKMPRQGEIILRFQFITIVNLGTDYNQR
jgi:hypothetical protein